MGTGWHFVDQLHLLLLCPFRLRCSVKPVSHSASKSSLLGWTVSLLKLQAEALSPLNYFYQDMTETELSKSSFYFLEKLFCFHGVSFSLSDCSHVVNVSSFKCYTPQKISLIVLLSLTNLSSPPSTNQIDPIWLLKSDTIKPGHGGTDVDNSSRDINFVYFSHFFMTSFFSIKACAYF